MRNNPGLEAVLLRSVGFSLAVAGASFLAGSIDWLSALMSGFQAGGLFAVGCGIAQLRMRNQLSAPAKNLVIGSIAGAVFAGLVAAAWVGFLREMHDLAVAFLPVALAANLLAGYLTGRVRVMAPPAAQDH